jgi:heat shock protein HtpX
MAGAKPASPTEYPDLTNIVENLSITAGLPKPKIYIINDPQPNAFATGQECHARSGRGNERFALDDEPQRA